MGAIAPLTNEACCALGRQLQFRDFRHHPLAQLLVNLTTTTFKLGHGETNRFADHTSLYVRVEDEHRNTVYATYSLGHVIAFDEPHAEIDRENKLHVLHCSAPRAWSYAIIGLNGQLLSHSTLLETKSRPHFKRTSNGEIAVVGGMAEAAAVQAVRTAVPKLSTRPNEKSRGD